MKLSYEATITITRMLLQVQPKQWHCVSCSECWENDCPNHCSFSLCHDRALLRQDWIKKGESPKTMNWETDRLTSGHFEKTWGTNIRPSGRMDRRYPRLKSFADLSSFFVTHACTCIHLQQHRTSRRGIVDMLFRWANALYRCCWARWVHGKQPSQMSTTLVLAQLL